MAHLKLKVTPSQSEFIQKFWFSKGYSWSSNDTEVSNTNKPFLYVNSRGTIQYSDSENAFNSDSGEETVAHTYIEDIVYDAMKNQDGTRWRTQPSNSDESKQLQEAFFRLGASCSWAVCCLFVFVL